MRMHVRLPPGETYPRNGVYHLVHPQEISFHSGSLQEQTQLLKMINEKISFLCLLSEEHSF